MSISPCRWIGAFHSTVHAFQRRAAAWQVRTVLPVPAAPCPGLVNLIAVLCTKPGNIMQPVSSQGRSGTLAVIKGRHEHVMTVGRPGSVDARQQGGTW